MCLVIYLFGGTVLAHLARRREPLPSRITALPASAIAGDRAWWLPSRLDRFRRPAISAPLGSRTGADAAQHAGEPAPATART